jgi:type II secretory ATPase GspE/PulE/Tfp pilus assembly ATPase PilB-like protein
MVMTPRIQELALQGVDSNVIKREARREGMRTLREDGAERVLEGQTTIEEIMRVTRDELMEEVATS